MHNKNNSHKSIVVQRILRISRKAVRRICLLLMTYALCLGAVSAQYTYNQIYKHYYTTLADSGAIVWTPATGKHIAITSVEISTYGTTTGRVLVWFGDSVSMAINDSVSVTVLDTMYTVGTDQPVVIATFSPSSTSKPTLTFTPSAPIICNSTKKLKITTEGNLTYDCIIYGFEW